jgi:hypothetical protein
MKQLLLAAIILTATACGGSDSGGGGGGGGGGTGPFVMTTVLVGSCHYDAGTPDEGCVAYRDNTLESVDVRQLFQTECTASAGSSYSTGQCGAATYGCCKFLLPNDSPGQWTAMYDCAIGDTRKPTASYDYQTACTTGGGAWSPGPPGL